MRYDVVDQPRAIGMRETADSINDETLNKTDPIIKSDVMRHSDIDYMSPEMWEKLKRTWILDAGSNSDIPVTKIERLNEIDVYPLYEEHSSMIQENFTGRTSQRIKTFGDPMDPPLMDIKQ